LKLNNQQCQAAQDDKVSDAVSSKEAAYTLVKEEGKLRKRNKRASLPLVML
jgi:hypothetical protein